MEGLTKKKSIGETNRSTRLKLPFDVSGKRVHFPTRLSPFWRFQLIGWATFSAFSFPLKWVLLESILGSILVSLYRDGLGFLLTAGMREIYRRIYPANLSPTLIATIVGGVSLAGGGVLTLFSVAFHSALDFEEGKIFKTSVVFGIFYFRTGLCLGWSLLYFGIRAVSDGAQRDLQLAKEQAERREAELQMLRAQINPHFLFNALNAILAALERQRQNLGEMIQALSDYLNYSLTHKDADLVPLGDECDALQSYLILEKARLRADLDISCHIDTDVRSIPVPGVILQPLVENAIKYGRETWTPPVHVRLRIVRKSDHLLIEVFNTGRWMEPRMDRASGGIGLENIRRRLEWLYSERAGIEICTEDNCVVVQVRIPANP